MRETWGKRSVQVARWSCAVTYQHGFRKSLHSEGRLGGIRIGHFVDIGRLLKGGCSRPGGCWSRPKTRN